MQRVVLHLKFKYLNFGNFKFRIPPKFEIKNFNVQNPHQNSKSNNS